HPGVRLIREQLADAQAVERVAFGADQAHPDGPRRHIAHRILAGRVAFECCPDERRDNRVQLVAVADYLARLVAGVLPLVTERQRADDLTFARLLSEPGGNAVDDGIPLE